jgi:hypothetical protein
VLDAITQLKVSFTASLDGLANRVTGLEATPAHTKRKSHASHTEEKAEHSQSSEDESDDQTVDAAEKITVKDLRKNDGLQRQVCERLNELSKATEHSQDSTQKGKRSGRNKTVHDVILHEVEWPQYHVNRTNSDKSPTYDELSLPEFVAGTLTSILEAEKVSALAKIQITHLIEIMTDAEDFSWAVLRQFHALVLQDLEMGKYAWGDSEKIQKRKQKHVARAELLARARPQPVGNRIGQNGNQNGNRPQTSLVAPTTPPILCKAFNLGECNSVSPHPTPEGVARHCCAYCSRTANKLCTHAEKYCRRKADIPHPYQNQQSNSNSQIPKNG